MSKRLVSAILASALSAAALSTPVAAESSQSTKQAETNAAEVIRVWTGKPAGEWSTQSPESVRSFPAGPGAPPIEVTVNVTDPTLTVYRPAAGANTGAAVLVVPGGGFMVLAMQHEGRDVGRWLASHGVTAFVLKYRVKDLQIPYADYVKDPAPYNHPFDKFLEVTEPSLAVAAMDAQQSMRLIRSQAKAFGIDPAKVGMMGFSAGAITTVRALQTNDALARPDFAVPVYGASLKEPAAKGAPPLFLVHAADDPSVPSFKSIDLYQTWRKANAPVELHMFEHGGHGFGLGKPGTAAAAWPELFLTWLKANKFIAN